MLCGYYCLLCPWLSPGAATLRVVGWGGDGGKALDDLPKVNRGCLSLEERGGGRCVWGCGCGCRTERRSRGPRSALGTGPWGGAVILTAGSVSPTFAVLWDRGGGNRVQVMKSERG